MIISNLLNNNGNSSPNQFVINSEKGVMFKSYNSNIVFIPNDGSKIVLGKNWNYSRTTSKFRSIFLNESTKETQNKLDNGIYKYDINL